MAEREYKLTDLNIRSLLSCKKCNRLSNSRNCVVPPALPVTKYPIRIMVIGEAPSKKEDIRGIPFCGPTAKRFNFIRKSLGIYWGDLWVTNAVKCYIPRWNKDGKCERWNEIEKCRNKWLFRELKSFKPHIVFTLGSTALKSLYLDEKYELKLKETWSSWPKAARYTNRKIEEIGRSVSRRTFLKWPSFLLCPFTHPSARDKQFPGGSFRKAIRHQLMKKYRRLMK